MPERPWSIAVARHQLSGDNLPIGITELLLEINVQVIRALTGRLFTKEQIDAITKHSVGKLLADFFPADEQEKDAIQRVQEAELHISRASQIVLELQSTLKARSETLQQMITEIEEKKKVADNYAAMASATEAQVSAIRIEIERVVRKELVDQANKNRRVRQAASAILWVVTLVAGAALGAYFPRIVQAAVAWWT
jgi:hypothetical protein